MADQKLTALVDLPTPSSDDILYIVDAPSGTPISKKVTVGNLSFVMNGFYNVKFYGAHSITEPGYATFDSSTAIQAALNAAFAAGGGQVYIPRGKYLLSSSLMLKRGVSIHGIYPGITPTDPGIDHWDNGWLVSTGSILTYPGGIVFTHDLTAGFGFVTAVDGIVVEKLGFDNVASIMTAGDANKTGICGSVIRDIYASNVTGVAFDLTNSMHLHMSNIKAALVYQLLRITNAHDSTIGDNQPGNSYFEDFYGFITAAGHAQPSIHIRSLNTGGNGTNMNYLYFNRMQVNRFLSTNLTGNHLRIEGDTATQSITSCNFDGLDFEGYADKRIYINNVTKTKLQFAGNALANVNSDLYVRNSNIEVDCPDSGMLLDMDGTARVIWNGSMKNVMGGGKFPYGLWYDQTLNEPRLGLDKFGIGTIHSAGNDGITTMPIMYMDFPSGGDVRQRVINWGGDVVLINCYLGCNTLSLNNDQAVTLPDAALCKGQSTTFKKIGTPGTVTITGHNGQHIDGADTNIWLDTQYKYITLQSDGANWLIISKG